MSWNIWSWSWAPSLVAMGLKESGVHSDCTPTLRAFICWLGKQIFFWQSLDTLASHPAQRQGLSNIQPSVNSSLLLVTVITELLPSRSSESEKLKDNGFILMDSWKKSGLIQNAVKTALSGTRMLFREVTSESNLVFHDRLGCWSRGQMTRG